MDVMVRNLPPSITEKQVEKFFRPELAKISVTTFSCRTFKGKGSAPSSAVITIPDAGKARKFLEIYGQAGHGWEHFTKVKEKLYCMRKPIYCSQSNQTPDRFLLRALEKDEIEKLTAKSRPSKSDSSKLKRNFGIQTLYCGQWDYVREQLVFMTHFQEQRAGAMMFGRQCLTIILHPAHRAERAQRVEIPYYDVQSFTIGNSSNPTATFALRAPPRLFEDLRSQAEDDLVENTRNLSFERKPRGFKRMRIMALRKSHEIVVSSCLCYQAMLEDPSDVTRLQALKRAEEIPESSVWNTTNTLKYDFPAQLTLLNTALSRSHLQTVSFEVKFQLQRLAQNGYLPPARVVELLKRVNRNFSNVDEATLIASIRKLSLAIPYAGPGTEASELSVTALSDLLAQYQKSAAMEASYSHLAEKYEHIALIHKATVTPVGIILSGPEPEIINRVIRKQVYLTVPDRANELLTCYKKIPGLLQLLSPSLLFGRELGINSVSSRKLERGDISSAI